MRIEEEAGKFFFKALIDIKAARDGSFFVQEEDKLYKFDADGKFVKNLYKKGEGPGEMNQNLNDVILGEDEIILFSSNMNKIIRTDMQGNLIQDLRPKELTYYSLLGYYNGNCYLARYEWQDKERKSGIFEKLFKLCILNSAREATPTFFIFPFTVSSYYGDRTILEFNISQFHRVGENQRYVYICHTPDYLVKLLDLEKIEIVRSFRRKYERVKYEYKGTSRWPVPIPKYHNDICRLAIFKDNLWVVTSTLDKEKGILVDVYNREGKYLDNFYLPLLNIKTDDIQYYARIVIYGNFLFIIEIDEDGLISIVKYEIIDE